MSQHDGESLDYHFDSVIRAQISRTNCSWMERVSGPIVEPVFIDDVRYNGSLDAYFFKLAGEKCGRNHNPFRPFEHPLGESRRSQLLPLSCRVIVQHKSLPSK